MRLVTHPAEMKVIRLKESVRGKHSQEQSTTLFIWEIPILMFIIFGILLYAIDGEKPLGLSIEQNKVIRKAVHKYVHLT